MYKTTVRLCFLSLMVFFPQGLWASDFVSILTRDRAPVFGEPPVTLQVVVTTSPKPRGVLLMLPGGNGKLILGDVYHALNSSHFMLRARQYFASQGFHVLVANAASDFSSTTQGLTGYRTGQEHLSDVAALINYARSRYTGLPVWLAGMSRGTASAANAAALLEPAPFGPDGLILFSSLTRPEVAVSESLEFIPLERVSVPTLLVAHRRDACPATPPIDTRKLVVRLKQGTETIGVYYFNRQIPALSPACGPLSNHGFFGIEAEVAAGVSRWITRISSSGGGFR